MPSRDEHGKRLPGSAQRKRAQLRDAADLPEDEDAPFDNPFDDLAPPPDDTAQLIRWGARVAGRGVHFMALHPEIYPNKREWMRALFSGIGCIGVIRDKASEQQKIDDALRRDDLKGKKQGLDDVRGKKAQAVTRPSG
jgi:hypothetical protein